MRRTIRSLLRQRLHRHLILPMLMVGLILLSSCGRMLNKIVCGEPKGRQKIFIDSVNARFGDKLTLTHVPCYGDYIEVHLKSGYEKALIDSLENGYQRSVSWAEFLVYNANGELIRGSKGSM